jgi:hypothetical protein
MQIWDTVTIGDKPEVNSLGTGTFYPVSYWQRWKKKLKSHIHFVSLVPDLWEKIFSITRPTSNKNCKTICKDKLITVNTKF